MALEEEPERRRAASANMSQTEKQLEELRGMAIGNDNVERKLKIVQHEMVELGAETEKTRSAQGVDHKRNGRS